MSERTEWQRADAILDRLLDLPADERRAALAGMGLEPELEARVARLLAAHEGPSGVLDAPPASATPRASSPTLRGRRFGTWEIDEEIGRGGMSVVFRAHDVAQPERRAALKLITLATLAGAGARPFEREQSILARLSHPSIAPLFDAGTSADGTPWLAMALVQGQRIDAWCDARELDDRARVRLLLEVCDAVAYAHQNLVIHRDIKPSNVLVTAQGKVCLLDFGIARLADEAAERTHSAYRALTPGYAAPEQLTGAPAATTMDVYGLGALLHALLLGEAPAGATGAVSTSRRAAAGRAPLPADLRAILDKALAADAAARYDGVHALRDDLQAWLEQRPVLARRGSRRYRVGRFIARHRTAVTAAALVLASLLAGLGGTLWQAQRALRAAHAADQARERAEASRDFLARLFRATLPTRPAQALPDTAELLAEGARRALRVGDEQAPLGLELATTLGAVYVQRRMTTEADPLVGRALALATRVGDAEPALFVRAQVLAALRAYLDRDFPRAAGYLAAAAPRATTLPEQHPARLEFHYAEAWFDYVQQQPGAAAKRLAPLWQRLRARDDVDPDDAIRVANTLALSLDNSGDGPGAAAVYEDILRIAERAYGRTHMNWAIPAVNAGNNAFNRGDFARADTLFSAGIAVYDTIRAEPMEQRATARSLQGLMWLAAGRLDDAEDAIRRARTEWAQVRGESSTDRDPVLHYRLGMVHAARGQWDRAAAAYRRAQDAAWPAGRGGELARIDVAILLADAQCAQRAVGPGRAGLDAVRERIAVAPDYTDARWLAWVEQAGARCALAAGEPDVALSALDAAATHDAGLARGHLADRTVRARLRALALDAVGRDDAARAVRDDAAQQMDAAGLGSHPALAVALLIDP